MSYTVEEISERSDLVVHALLGAFEHDLRDFIDEFVNSSYEISEVLGDRELELRGRFEQRNPGKKWTDIDSREKLNSLFLAEAIDLLSSHRKLLPEDLIQDIDLLNLEENRKVYFPIRNSDAHFEPQDKSLQKLLLLLQALSPLNWTRLFSTIRSFFRGELSEEIKRLLPGKQPVANNLAAREHEKTKLVGRNLEVKQIMADLRSRYVHVVSIVAEGGLGKTALALEVAYEFTHSDDFGLILYYSAKTEKWTTQGIQKIDNVETDLFSAVASLGKEVDPAFSGDIDEFLAVLGDTPTLIVLDNFETFTGADFEALFRKFPENSKIKLLITSRWGIGNHETRFPLKPLEGRQAIHLLNMLSKQFGQNDIQTWSDEQKTRLIQEFGQGRPLDLVWLVKARSIGSPLSEIRTNKEKLVSFCVANVLGALGPEAKELVLAMSISDNLTMSLAEAFLVLEYDSVDQLTPLIQDLTRLNLVTLGSSVANPDSETLTLNETVCAYFLSTTKADQIEFWHKRVSQVKARLQKEYENQFVTSPFSIYRRSPEDNEAALILNQAILKSRDSLDGAISLIRSADALRPGYFEVERVAGFLFGKNKPDQARIHFNNAIAQTSNDVEKARVAYVYAEFLSAIELYDEALDWSSFANKVLDDPSTMVQGANLLIKFSRFEEAETVLKKAEKLAQWQRLRIVKTSLLRLYERWARAQYDLGLPNATLLIKANRLVKDSLASGQIDGRGANAILKFAIAVLQFEPRITKKEPELADEFHDDVEIQLHLIARDETGVLTNANSAIRKFFAYNLEKSTWAESVGIDKSVEGEDDGFIHGFVERNKETFAILRSGNRSYFAHGKSLDGVTFKQLPPGVRVKFKIEPNTPQSGQFPIAISLTLD